jgi:hypothetical protein
MIAVGCQIRPIAFGPDKIAPDMSDGPNFPKKDEHGRIESVVDLFGMVLAGVVSGVVILLAVDGVVFLFGGTFGRASGWLAAVLPAWLFVEEFRVWRGARRWPVALGSALLAVAVGLAAAGVASFLPPLVSGAVGATFMSFAYAVLWFHGIRALGRKA